MIFDPLYLLLVLPTVLLGLWASSRTSSAFKRYAQVPSRVGLSGAQVARRLLDAEGLRDVEIERIGGQLTDHYDPRQRVLRLSTPVHDGTSLASIGVAAHEMGHAIQHAHGYSPLLFRQAFFPVAAFASRAWVWLFFIGIFAGAMGKTFMLAAAACMAVYAAFAIVTLPVEYDATRRALVTLEGSRTLEGEELEGAGKVLSAAGLTYVASAATAVMQAVYLFLRARD